MPIIMESSMFSYSIGKFNSNHTNVGFDFAKVDGVSTRFGFLIETKCVPMILLSEREQFGHRTFGLA